MKCPVHIEENPNVSQNSGNVFTWFRENETKEWTRVSQETNSRLRVIKNRLQFWPVEAYDNGQYLCVYGNSTHNATSDPLSFIVKRRNADECSNPVCALERSANRGIAGTVLCGVAETVPNITNILWYKGCDLLNQPNELRLHFRTLSDTDSGNYTCVVTLTREGKNYTHTKTTQLLVKDPEESVIPNILEGDSISSEAVEIGKPHTLKCKGFIGHMKENRDHNIYWLKKEAGSNPIVVMECANKKWKTPCETEVQFNYDNGNAFLSTEVHFEEVKEEDLKFNYICKLDNPFGNKNKTFELRKKEQPDIAQRTFTTGITLAIVLPILFILMSVVCLIFRIDLVLQYRRITNKDETKSDGKEYDAYVSYLKYSKLETEAETKFALEVLSHTLEDFFGYKLCIFERDVMPGGATVDDIDSLIDKSRRLIIILSKNYTSDNAMYELESGLYKSLVERKTKVIVIEYNLPEDFTLLPESLDLLKSSSKLKWEEDRSRPLNSKFWKKMQYLMPAKPFKPPGEKPIAYNGKVVTFSSRKKYTLINCFAKEV
ncbi:interleukin-18 receptor 1-like [Lissotriton helveticus]